MIIKMIKKGWNNAQANNIKENTTLFTQGSEKWLLSFKWAGTVSLLICDQYETPGTVHCEIFTCLRVKSSDFCEDQVAASLKLLKLEWSQLPNSDLRGGNFIIELSSCFSYSSHCCDQIPKRNTGWRVEELFLLMVGNTVLNLSKHTKVILLYMYLIFFPHLLLIKVLIDFVSCLF